MTEQQILNILKSKGVFSLTPKDFANRFMTKNEMIEIFNYFDAFWEYQGEPNSKKPHALLKAGDHSNGFIACKNVLQHPIVCELFANEIFKYLEEKEILVDVVASSAYSAINLGYEVAKIISKQSNARVEYVTVEKDEKGNPTIIRGGIDPSKKVLVINELMTTGSGSTWETKQAVINCNGEGNPVPQIITPSFVLVHRSEDYILPDGSEVFPIFHFDIKNFKPEECQYCKANSEAIKPKVGNNWNLIHGRI
jgi:orotate phosphoribosyltransferase